MKKTFEVTCVFDKDEKYYEHFWINEKIAFFYGNKPEEIVTIKMKVSKNQKLKSFEEGKLSQENDYWGWYDFEEKKFRLIWHKRLFLEMCFPDMKASEEAKHGKAYRLEIVT